MSVWASGFVLGDTAWDGEQDLGPPIIYRQSHVLPGAEDPRGGSLDIASIPAFLTRDGYDDGPDDGDVWPFLRVSLRSAQMTDDLWVEDTLVLTAAQVSALRDALTDWLGRVDHACPTRRKETT